MHILLKTIYTYYLDNLQIIDLNINLTIGDHAPTMTHFLCCFPIPCMFSSLTCCLVLYTYHSMLFEQLGNLCNCAGSLVSSTESVTQENMCSFKNEKEVCTHCIYFEFENVIIKCTFSSVGHCSV